MGEPSPHPWHPCSLSCPLTSLHLVLGGRGRGCPDLAWTAASHPRPAPRLSHCSGLPCSGASGSFPGEARGRPQPDRHVALSGHVPSPCVTPGRGGPWCPEPARWLLHESNVILAAFPLLRWLSAGHPPGRAGARHSLAEPSGCLVKTPKRWHFDRGSGLWFSWQNPIPVRFSDDFLLPFN